MQDRLKAEVEAEIKRLGRASLVDLAASVGVELVHCERVAEQIVASNPDLSFIQGEIVADSYWDTVAEEINEALQESGQVAVGELAKRFNVGSEQLTRVLESRIGKSVNPSLLDKMSPYRPHALTHGVGQFCGCIDSSYCVKGLASGVEW